MGTDRLVTHGSRILVHDMDRQLAVRQSVPPVTEGFVHVRDVTRVLHKLYDFGDLT
jgi:hypothetical protein